ncbi:MAG: hypothetical protein DRN04_07920 [Thermoprotei archaeon]|nr:MAG: hypothetical protein DRN04_07920 [Thermoprotei archaeon]
MYIIDASIYASVAVKDEFYEKSRSFLTQSRSFRCITLDIALIEAYNALWKHVYLLKRIPIKNYRNIAVNLRKIFEKSVRKIFNAIDIADDALNIAINYGITVYDSAHLALAEKTGYKLITYDKELKRRLEKTNLEKNIYVFY